MYESVDGNMCIRCAEVLEAEYLSDIAFRSKAHWGYDSNFMEACRQALCVTSKYIKDNDVFVLSDGGVIMGFCCMRCKDEAGHLDALFIDPGHMGRGYGRHLWTRCLQVAKQRGVRSITIEADPHAEGFYSKMGAKRVGEADSECIGGRRLPLMRIDLSVTPVFYELIERK